MSEIKEHARVLRKLPSTFLVSIPKAISKEFGFKGGEIMMIAKHNDVITIREWKSQITEADMKKSSKAAKAIERMMKNADNTDPLPIEPEDDKHLKDDKEREFTKAEIYERLRLK